MVNLHRLPKSGLALIRLLKDTLTTYHWVMAFSKSENEPRSHKEREDFFFFLGGLRALRGEKNDKN